MHNDINLVGSEVKLLYDIRELLIEQNRLFNMLVVNKHSERYGTENNVSNDGLDGLKRHDLLARAKGLPNKPNKWSLLPNEELKILIKEGEKE